MLEYIFNNAAGLKVCNFVKKKLQHSCLPVKRAKFLKTPFFTEEFRWLLLTLTHVFTGVRGKNMCDCQQYITDSAEKSIRCRENPEAPNVGVL